MDDDSSAIVTLTKGTTAIVRFNRPAQRNPLSSPTLHALQSTLSTLMSRKDIEAVIFTGTDDIFLSGADIRELAELDTGAAAAFSKLGQSVFQIIATSRQLTIAAINGYCMGGGLDLALACDIRIAGSNAVFSHPGARLGIITGWGGTQRLPRAIGRANAMEFFVTAKRFTSADALRIGLITEIHDPVLDHALRLAAKKEGGEISASFSHT